MPVRLFSLRGVPDDEAEEVRQLLTDNKVDYYETSAGNWGISMPGIWLHDDQQLQHAKQLINEYQVERALRQRENYEQLKREGKQKTFLAALIEDPLKIIAYLALSASSSISPQSPFYLLVNNSTPVPPKS